MGGDETGWLDGKNAWVEVGPLKQDLAPDPVVSARLVLGPYEVPLRIHASSLPWDWVKRGGTMKPSPDSVVSGGPTWFRAITC